MSKASQDAALVTITLRLSKSQAEELHDLVVDADMHQGRVSTPIPLSDGLADAVCFPIIDALSAARRAS